jgi:hypothetical protein
MPNELPPETAGKFLSLYGAIGSGIHSAEWMAYFHSITPEDVAALEACDPDKVKKTSIISDDFARVIDGPGIYDKYERAGWVKRQPEPTPVPEEWGPWVKLAKVGERPGGVEFGVGEQVEQKGSAGYAVCDYATQPWKAVTHYRRKRILCVWSVVGTHRTLLWGKEACGHSCEPGHYALRGTRWTPATAPEVTAAKAGRDPNGVVAWHGGECPEGSGIVHYQDGETRGGLRFSVRLSDWTRDDDPSDIIAYEVTG